nr:unnamed protein product [Haemonchus contortus]
MLNSGVTLLENSPVLIFPGASPLKRLPSDATFAVDGLMLAVASVAMVFDAVSATSNGVLYVVSDTGLCDVVPLESDSENDFTSSTVVVRDDVAVDGTGVLYVASSAVPVTELSVFCIILLDIASDTKLCDTVPVDRDSLPEVVCPTELSVGISIGCSSVLDASPSLVLCKAFSSCIGGVVDVACLTVLCGEASVGCGKSLDVACLTVLRDAVSDSGKLPRVVCLTELNDEIATGSSRVLDAAPPAVLCDVLSVGNEGVADIACLNALCGEAPVR